MLSPLFNPTCPILNITWFPGIMGSFWVLILWKYSRQSHLFVWISEFLNFLKLAAAGVLPESFCLVSEEGTTKLENPRICEAEQHLFMLTMKTCILSILIAVLIHCLTGKFNMDLPFLCWEFECYWKYYPRYIILKITEHVGEHCHEETEKYKTHSFRYSKFDCRAKDSIFLITWLDCILQFPLLDTKDVTNCRQMTEFCG